MKLLSSFVFIAMMMSCSSKDTSVKYAEAVHADPEGSLFSKKVDYYTTNNVQISLTSKTTDELLKEHHFDNDSIYQVYKKALSGNIYYTLKLQPTDRPVVAMQKVNEKNLLEKTMLVVCEDTLKAIEISPLQDFGLSKSKQYLMVFQKVKHLNCSQHIFVAGVFNAYDHYEFQIGN